MSVEKGLFQLVTQEATVMASLGTSTAKNQAFWILAPQGAKMPLLIFSRIATGDNYAMSGTIGLRDALFQITCYATTYLGSRAIADAVRKFLENYTGTLPDADCTLVKGVFIEKDWDMQYESGDKSFIYGGCLHLRVWYYD